MNLISYEKAYCLFPRATLEERRNLLIARGSGSDQLPAVRKYQERGWSPSLPSLFWGRAERSPVFPFGNRFLGDRHTWTIPLDLTGVTPPQSINPQSQVLTQDPAVGSTWEFNYKRGKGGLAKYVIIADPSLFYGYINRDPSAVRAVQGVVSHASDWRLREEQVL